MKKFLLVFLINFFIYNSIAYTQQILTIVIVNNVPITNIDIKNEISLNKILNPKVDRKLLENISVQNLINQIIKIEEIKKNNVQISDLYIKKIYNNFLSGVKHTDLSKVLKENIYLRIKTEESWKKLITKKFLWNSFVNINEIDSNLKNLDTLSKDSEKKFNTKEKMIRIEKNKKLSAQSKIYLSKLKKEALIKIY